MFFLIKFDTSFTKVAKMDPPKASYQWRRANKKTVFFILPFILFFIEFSYSRLRLQKGYDPSNQQPSEKKHTRKSPTAPQPTYLAWRNAGSDPPPPRDGVLDSTSGSLQDHGFNFWLHFVEKTLSNSAKMVAKIRQNGGQMTPQWSP